jgi:hypothetical protein
VQIEAATDTGDPVEPPADAAGGDPVTSAFGVRPMQPEAETLVREARHLSPTVARQLAKLEQSDVIVYLAVRTMEGFQTSGTSFVARTGRARLVRVEIARNKRQDEAIATLGHERQHVLEVAASAEVVNPSSFDGLFRRIGAQVTARSFETQAAVDIGGRVAAEVKTAHRQTR